MDNEWIFDQSDGMSSPRSQQLSSSQQVKNNEVLRSQEKDDQNYEPLDFLNGQVQFQEKSQVSECGNQAANQQESQNHVQIQVDLSNNQVHSYSINDQRFYVNEDILCYDSQQVSSLRNNLNHSQDIYYQQKNEVHNYVINQDDFFINNEFQSEDIQQVNNLDNDEISNNIINQDDNQFMNEANIESVNQADQQDNTKVTNQFNNLNREDQLNQQTTKPKNKYAQYGKNSAKQLGNYLTKHITKRKMTHIPQLAQFANKKKRNVQANYTIKDWSQMLLENNQHQTECQEFVLDYLTNWAYVDIVLEYKQEFPVEMIEHIEHFCRGCTDPANFICNKRN